MKIFEIGADVLRQPAMPIEDVHDPAVQGLIDELLETVFAANGVGIAAPQVGHSLQLMIIASRPSPRYPYAPEMAPLAMLNPRISKQADSLTKDWEGCLSVPGIRGLVPRYDWVEIDYLDRDGGQHSVKWEGFLARVFQHEYDHLVGKTYLDRLESNLDIVSESEFQKRLG